MKIRYKNRSTKRRTVVNTVDWQKTFVATGIRCPGRWAVGRMILAARSVLCHPAADTQGEPQAVDFQAKSFILRAAGRLGAGGALRERSTSFIQTAAIVPDKTANGAP
jgi:hypothetical protein